MVNFPTWNPDCDSHSFVLLDFFLSSDPRIYFTVAFPKLKNSDYALVKVSNDFPSNSKGDAPFHCTAYDYSRADLDGLYHHLSDVPWENVFKLGASAAASEFSEQIQVGIWTNKSYASYLGLIFAKEFLKLPKLFILIKQKIYYFPEFSHNFQALTIFWWIANSVLDKSEPTTPPSFNGPKLLSCASDKAKLFAKNFSRNSNLDDSGISLPAFLSRTNLKLHNIHVTPKLVKKVINNLDPLKASGTDCIPVVVLRK